MKSPLSVDDLASKLVKTPWLARLLAALAGILYFAQSLWFARTQWSVLDEGNYAYKGWLFVTGQYVPYQPDGFWTNHMPLSFLTYGAVQLLFGPGLRTVRYFSLFVGCLFLLGTWLAVRRIGGRWMAAAAILALALNPFEISDYSVGITQVLIGCLLVWTLYFTLGDERSPRELAVGAVLLSAMILTRENLILIAPFVCVYVFVQHGRRPGLVFTGIILLLLLATHALYWPGILIVWGRWIPKSLAPYFPDWVYHGGGTFAWSTDFSLSNDVRVFFASIRLNFLAVFGAAAVWLGWPKGGFKNPYRLRIILLLTAIFVTLYAAHAWASFGKDYCPDCLINYVSFFYPIGLLLFFAFLAAAREYTPGVPAWVTAAVILVLIAGIGYSNYEVIGPTLASIAMPRVSDFALQPGSVELWRLLANKFGLSFQVLVRLLPVIFGLLLGLGLLAAAWALHRRTRSIWPFASLGYALIFVTLFAGIWLSPTSLLGGMDPQAACGQDVIARYELVGNQLAQRIPPGSRVYWKGDPSPAALLYVPGIKIYPPQTNGIYSFILGGDTAEARRFGFWNEALDRQWLSDADFLLIRGAEVVLMQPQIPAAIFEELEPTSPISPCSPETRIRIFKRK